MADAIGAPPPVSDLVPPPAVPTPAPPVPEVKVESAPPPAAPVAPAAEAPKADAPTEATKSEAAPAPAAPAHPAEVPSLLETVGKEEPKAADKPADAKVPDAPPAAEKTEWKFELPEHLQADEPKMQQFTGILDELIAPKEGETRQQVAQRMLNLHAEAMTSYATHLQNEQIRAFNDTRSEWRKQAMADNQIGGAGFQTAMRAIARMRDLFVSDHKPGSSGYTNDAKEFDAFLRTTGAGDHPAFLKFLHRVAGRYDEPAQPPPNPKPPPDLGRAPGSKSFYANRSPGAGA